MAFLQAPETRTSRLHQPCRGAALEHTTIWEPYLLERPAVILLPDRVFDELCKLTEIGTAVQDLLFDGENHIVGTELQQAAEALLSRLCDWKKELPLSLDVEGETPPTPAVFELQ